MTEQWRAKRSFKKTVQPIPLNTKFIGIFNGLNVVIEDLGQMKELSENGCFGKSNFARSRPILRDDYEVEIIRARVFKQRQEWKDIDKKLQKVIVLPDSEDDSDEDYFNNLIPKYEIDLSGIKEKLHLSLEESFFLIHGLNCLEIKNEEKTLDIDQAWKLFESTDEHFTINYLVYYYYRTKNWVVKTGIKFGGDFLLYKKGPQYYHASYVIVIDVLNGNHERLDHLNRRSMDLKDLSGLNRLCETAGKQLIICQIIWPDSVTNITYDNLKLFRIKEIQMKRWISNHN